jgi:hypothetical protein
MDEKRRVHVSANTAHVFNLMPNCQLYQVSTPKQRTQHNFVELLQGCAISVTTNLIPISLFTVIDELTCSASFPFAALFQIIRTATSGGMA